MWKCLLKINALYYLMAVNFQLCWQIKVIFCKMCSMLINENSMIYSRFEFFDSGMWLLRNAKERGENSVTTCVLFMFHVFGMYATKRTHTHTPTQTHHVIYTAFSANKSKIRIILLHLNFHCGRLIQYIYMVVCMAWVAIISSTAVQFERTMNMHLSTCFIWPLYQVIHINFIPKNLLSCLQCSHNFGCI